MEVQQTQYELFKIESIRFRESIKPLLKYSASHNKLMSGDPSKRILTIEVINESNSPAVAISKIVSDPSTQTQQIFIPMGFSDTRNHLNKGDDPLLFHFTIDLNSPLGGWVAYTMNYEDVSGTKYLQHLFCLCDKHGIEIHPSLPEITS